MLYIYDHFKIKKMNQLILDSELYTLLRIAVFY